MARYTFAVLLVAALFFTGPALQADDDEKAPKLSVRIYDVGALTHGRMPFRSQFPPVQDPQRPGDALLLVSSEVPEPVYPIGMTDELIEVAKSSVAPAFWESTEGADMRARGERTLVVRASDPVHAELGRTLAALEKRFLQMVTVELRAVRLTPAERAALTSGGDATRLDAARVEQLLASDAAGPALRLLLENGTSAEGFGGAQRTFLRSHNIEVAQSAQTSAPIIGVANPGLAAVVRPSLGVSRSSRLRLAVRASLAYQSAFRAETTATGDTVELPAHALLDLYDDVMLEPGRWGLLGGVARADGGPQWMLLARATPVEAPVPETARPLSIDTEAEAIGDGESYEDLTLRMFDVRAMNALLFPAPGTGAFLRDTAIAPRAYEEMPEPAPPFPAESLVELLRECVGGEACWQDPATIEMRNGIVIVRHKPATVAAVGGFLEKLARWTPGVIETSVTAIEVSDAAAHALAKAMAGKGAVLTDDASALLARALAQGEARQIGEAQVVSTGGVRNTVCGGKHVSYLQTYAVEVAQSAARARPVTGQYLAGFEVELEAHGLVGGTSALLQLRLMHTREEAPTRTQNTAHGKVDLPSLATARVRSTLTVPLGKPAWVALTRGEGKPVVFLATARRQAR